MTKNFGALGTPGQTYVMMQNYFAKWKKAKCLSSFGHKIPYASYQQSPDI